MPSIIDWNSLGGEMEADAKKREDRAASRGSGGKVAFLNMKEPDTYVFRPVGKAVRFYKIFVNKKPVIVDLEYKDEAVSLLNEHFGIEARADLKFAMYVIDRADQKIKVLEGNYGMLSAITNWAAQTKEAPGGQNGSDWSIKATGKGFGGDNPRRYQTNALMTKPLTSEELSMLEEAKDGLPKLEDLFKATALDQLVGRITGSDGPSSEPSASATATASVAVAPGSAASALDF